MNKNQYNKSLVWSVVFFAGSLTVNYFASLYASERVSAPVTDIILSNLPVIDVGRLIIYGSLILILVTLSYILRNPNKIPFALKSLALFIFIRSIFITLTHLGPFTPQIIISTNPITSLGLGNAADLFFSGHTGVPFLGALVFWDTRILRYIYLVSSAILGVAVLLGHLHYSIDVLAAFFITHTIYHISKILFKDDWALFHF